MDIRTRLIFALVAISLGSMAALGAFAYGTVQDILLQNQLHTLEAVAASKEQDLERVLIAWRDRVRLVTSRTQLRILLDRLARQPEGQDYRDQLEHILHDARSAVLSLRGIQLYSRDGEPVVRSGLLLEGEAPHPDELADLEGVHVHRDALHGPDGELLITFVAPMNLVDRRIGSAWVVLSAAELVDVTGDYTGLGRTGETVLAKVLPGEDGLVALGALRHDPHASLRRRLPSERGGPMHHAVVGDEGPYTEVVDYRGQPVYAATRWIPDPGWGLVVKVDVAEQREAIVALRDTLFKLALSLSALGIVAGMGLGLVFARPIRELAEVAQRIGAGEWDLRADESAEDEIGQLGMTFNQMTEQLVAANRELEERLRSSGNGKT